LLVGIVWLESVTDAPIELALDNWMNCALIEVVLIVSEKESVNWFNCMSRLYDTSVGAVVSAVKAIAGPTAWLLTMATAMFAETSWM